MLKVTLEHAGIGSRVELDGQDISNYLTEITINAAAGEITSAVLHYSGAVVVEGDAGRVELQQAAHLVICAECRRTLRGEPVEPHVVWADVTPLSAMAREYTVADREDA